MGTSVAEVVAEFLVLMTIDVHAHILERELLETLSQTPNAILNVERTGVGFRIAGYGDADPLLYDLDSRLANLERRGVELQLVAPPPPLWSKPTWAAGVRESQLLNAATRRAVAASHGRLAGLLVLALAEPEKVVGELRREFDAGGFAGVALPTSAAGHPLDDAGFEPLFSFLSSQRIFTFMHAVTSEPRRLLREYTLNTVIGWPTETAMAIARLIFAGVLERHPLNMVVSHGGGVLPFLAGRIDLAYSAPKYESNPACQRNISRLPSSFLRELYFDTVVASPLSLSWLLEFAGEDHVVFGSDFPYEIGDAEGCLAAPALQALKESARAKILIENARRMLARSREGNAVS